MTLNIIHLSHRVDRRIQLQKQLENQDISDFIFWEGCYDKEKPSRGIAKAHQQIVAWAANNSLNDILIAEDDIEFTGKNAFHYFLQNEPQDYDLYLGGISYGKIKEDYTVDDFAGTHLYKIRKRFFERFNSLSGQKDIDRDLANKGKYVVCNPMIAIQSDGFSDNTKEYRNNKVFFEKRSLWHG